MAHIEKRTTAKGKIRYRAQIILKGHPRVSATYSTRRDLIGRYIEVKVPRLARAEDTARNLRWWAQALGEHT